MKKITPLIVVCTILTTLLIFTPPTVQAAHYEVAVPLGYRPWNLLIDSSNNIFAGANKMEGSISKGYILKYNGTFSSFPLNDPNPGPILGITVDSEGNVWVAERDAHKIAKLSGDTVTEYAVGSSEDPAYPITVEANGTDIWIGCAKTTNNKIMKFIPSTQTLINYSLPALYSDAKIQDIKIRNGTVWFTDARNNCIGELDPATSNFTFHGPLTSHSCFLDIDSQGKVWFTENWANRIGCYNPANSSITEYVVPSWGDDTPYGITIDSNDDIWFSEFFMRKIGVFDQTQQIFTEYDITSSPYDVVKNQIGNIWFLGAGSWKLGRLDPTNYVGKRKENGLQVTISTKSTATVGKEFTIKVMIKNVAPETVNDITVSLRLGKKLTLTNGQLKTNIGTLKTGQWTTLEWHVKATKAGKHRSALSATGLLMDGTSANARVAWRIIAAN